LRLLRRLRDERGLTLVELMLTLSIMSVVLASVSLLLVRGNNTESDMSTRFRAQSGVRVAVDRLDRDVHCAQSVSGSATLVTLVLPAGCSSGGTVSWCTVGSGSRYALYRQSGATCGASGVRWADYLTTGSVFTIFGHSPTTLAKLRVDLTMSLRAALRPSEAYELQDDLVLRNSTRG
jgi:prepilin-type N-terminal cleavage/methylation domain-containing protein